MFHTIKIVCCTVLGCLKVRLFYNYSTKHWQGIYQQVQWLLFLYFPINFIQLACFSYQVYEWSRDGGIDDFVYAFCKSRIIVSTLKLDYKHVKHFSNRCKNGQRLS